MEQINHLIAVELWEDAHESFIQKIAPKEIFGGSKTTSLLQKLLEKIEPFAKVNLKHWETVDECF